MIKSTRIWTAPVRGVLAIFMVLLLGCAPVPDSEYGQDSDANSGEVSVTDGMKRLYLRIDADPLMCELAGVDLSSGILDVNGIEYEPIYNKGVDSWYVDVEESSFQSYTGVLTQQDSDFWYDESPISGIRIPEIQFNHKFADFAAIPLVGGYDSSLGEYIGFRTPYSLLEFELNGMDDITSVRLSSPEPIAGKASWSRSEHEFVYTGTSEEILLNCTGASDSQKYRFLVMGRKLASVTMRVCSGAHKSVEIPLGDIDLQPGDVYSRKLHLVPDPAQLWFEGFDLCVWGGDIVGKKSGVAPSVTAPGVDGDDTLSGYEYAMNHVTSDAAGSGFIQKSFYQGQTTVLQSHGMSDTYIRSRCFDRNRYMLRCREYDGYISVGTGDRSRGWFALYPLEKCGVSTVKNLDIRFRICIDSRSNDDVLFLINGSEDAITHWYIDDAGQALSDISHYGTSDTLRFRTDVLGKGQWRNIRVLVDNCTDMTALHWLGASSEDGYHGFYLDEISICEQPEAWKKSDDKLRILSWNIQNGMWADQPDYDNFVSFVSKYQPDICVWCEAKTNHQTGSGSSLNSTPYLPDNWDRLAASYGHSHVSVSRRGKENFPQVVTSRYPIEKLLQIGDIPGGDPVLHGAGLFCVRTALGDVHLLTIHLSPNPHDGTALEGDNLRLYEITEILDATVNSTAYGHIPDWIVLGDFNAVSRNDIPFHGTPDNGTRYQVHDYIAENTSLTDVMATRYPHCFMYTTASSRRIDYVYMDENSYGRITDACVLTERWTDPQYTSISNFYTPSDHRPILIDMQY